MITDLTTIMSNILTYEGDKREVLKNWAESIIDECAGSFECEMEGEIYTDSIGLEHDETRPVLNRNSILDVKNMIK